MGSRVCGGCTACCTIFGIEELGKKPWTECEHLTKAPFTRGCSIYRKRPRSCREFNCLWLGGAGTVKARPDRLGVMFAPTNGVTEFTGEWEFQAYEVFPGAFGKPDVVLLAKLIAGRDKLIIGHRHGGGVLTFIGPPEKIKAAQEWTRKQNEGA